MEDRLPSNLIACRGSHSSIGVKAGMRVLSIRNVHMVVLVELHARSDSKPGRTMAKTKKKPPAWGVEIDGIKVLRDPETACKGLAKDDVIGIDLETTGLSPWRNDIALIQLYGEQTSTLAVLQVREGEVPPCVIRLIESGKKFVVHNGVGFDLMFMDQAAIQWRKSQWYDTLVGETVLASTGRRDVSKSLRGSLRRRLGKDIDKDIEHGHWAVAELSDRQVEYAAQDVISLPALYRSHLAKADESGQLGALDMEMELMPIVAQMTINGLPCYAKRVEAYVEKQAASIVDSEAWLKKRFKNQDINLNSTKQLKEALAGVGIEVESTAVDVLEPIAQFGGKAGEVVSNILQWRHGAQRVKMYSEEWRNEHITNGRIHPRFWQCSADTTRFTCSDPNLQQVPKDSRGDIIGGLPGYKIVSADYSQIEVRIAAFQAGDEVLMKQLESDDVHSAIAAAVFGIKQKDVTKEQRSIAKAMTFLLLFGGGVQRFYEYVKMSGSSITFEDASNIVYRFFTTFTGLKASRTKAERMASRPGPAFIRLPNGCRRILVGYNKKSTTILNTMVQGAAAVGIKYGMIEADRRGITKYLGGQVHDELVSAVPNKEVKDYGHELAEAMIVGMHRVIDSTVKVEVKSGLVWQS
jgi:DNA polymerase I